MQTSKLRKDHIGIASGLTHLSDTSKMSESQKRLRQKMIDTYCQHANATLKKHDRMFSVPAQTVEVLDIYDQAEYAQMYSTPTWSEIVARVRAKNFDGQTVEIIVSLSDLDIGATFPQETAKNIIVAAQEWLERGTK
jgi:hypothetical protein